MVKIDFLTKLFVIKMSSIRGIKGPYLWFCETMQKAGVVTIATNKDIQQLRQLYAQLSLQESKVYHDMCEQDKVRYAEEYFDNDDDDDD